LVKLPQRWASGRIRFELGVAPSYFLFGVDPGIWKERNLTADVPVAMSCVPVCWGESSNAKAKDYFQKLATLASDADTIRPDLAAARDFLAKN